MCGVNWSIPSLSVEVWHTVLRLGSGLLIIAGALVAGPSVQRLIVRIVGRTGTGHEDVTLLLGQTARTSVIALGLITALGTIGVNVSALVAGLGLTGFALGFAFRDALSNVLAGAMILFYHPFRRHDRIKVTDFEGVVTEINLRYTIIERNDGQVLLPNSNLLTNPIVVFSSQSTLKSPSP